MRYKHVMRVKYRLKKRKKYNSLLFNVSLVIINAFHNILHLSKTTLALSDRNIIITYE